MESESSTMSQDITQEQIDAVMQMFGTHARTPVTIDASGPVPLSLTFVDGKAEFVHDERRMRCQPLSESVRITYSGALYLPNVDAKAKRVYTFNVNARDADELWTRVDYLSIHNRTNDLKVCTVQRFEWFDGWRESSIPEHVIGMDID